MVEIEEVRMEGEDRRLSVVSWRGDALCMGPATDIATLDAERNCRSLALTRMQKDRGEDQLVVQAAMSAKGICIVKLIGLGESRGEEVRPW